jgi:hypothetical protein
MREQGRPVDFLNVNAAVLDGLNGAGDLKQLARGLFGIGERSISGVFSSAGLLRWKPLAAFPHGVFSGRPVALVAPCLVVGRCAPD